MPLLTVNVACAIKDSFRVRQVAGMFDLPTGGASRESFTVDIPASDEAWTIGAIVGPSGSGKTSVARQAFGAALFTAEPWPADAAVIDGFPEVPIKEITHTLTAVGFSSPPAWLRPYHVLSNGERFRCDLARALMEKGPRAEESESRKAAGLEDQPTRALSDPSTLRPSSLVVFDEFTSVVDRTVARIGSAAVSRAIRTGRLATKFVAVTCHYDVLEWLEPDWVLDMATCQLARGQLRRPQISLEVIRCRPQAWRLFARHHYLSGDLTPISRCYMALWEGQPVAFCATIGLYGFRGRRRVTRIVTLPDYQGMGIGVRFLEHVCRLERAAGYRVNITASHPAILGYCRHSPHWRAINFSPLGRKTMQISRNKPVKTARGRSVVSFEFVPAS